MAAPKLNAPRGSDPHARRIPRWVKVQVAFRDAKRCSFVSPNGTRCEATSGLQFDHIKPWALGGSSNDPSNIRLLCAAHNRHEAEKVFGKLGPRDA
jgi:hypothetical protein